MTITVEEKWESRPSVAGRQASVDLIYNVHGTSEDLAAKAALLAAAPLIYDDMLRDPGQTLRVERIAEESWIGTIHYIRSDKPSRYEFDTSGGTHHISVSRKTVQKYSESESTPPPDHKGAIGWDGEKVQGVDIVIPNFVYAEAHHLPVASLTQKYIGASHDMTGTVNEADWRGFGKCEALFMGAQGSYTEGDETCEITFKFHGSKSVMNLMIGGIGPIQKLGWEYLWVLFEHKKDTPSNTLVKRPRAVYVEEVYRYSNFLGLGIGK